MSLAKSSEPGLQDQELHLISLINEQTGLEGIPSLGPWSDTNKVYFYPDTVLRVGGLSLLHEAMIAPHIPEETGYPGILGHGEVNDDGHIVNFMVMRRAEGLQLRQVWPDMPPDEHRRALGSVPLKLALIHNLQVTETDWPAQAPHLPIPFGEALFDGLSPIRFRDKLRESTNAGWLDKDLAKRVRDRYDDLWAQTALPAQPKAAPYVVSSMPNAVCLHNDAGIHNLLWSSEEGETKLLDFELAGRGPREIDWFHFIRSVYFVSKNTNPLANIPDDLLGQLDEQNSSRMTLFSIVRGLQIIDGWRTGIYEEGQSVSREKEKISNCYTGLEEEANSVGIFSRLLQSVR